MSYNLRERGRMTKTVPLCPAKRQTDATRAPTVEDHPTGDSPLDPQEKDAP